MVIATVWDFADMQGTLIVIPLLPYGLAEHIYGSDVLLFKPQRWLPTAAAAPVHSAARSASPAGPAADGSTATTPATLSAALGGSASATAAGIASAAVVNGASRGAATAAPPDPLTFMTGQRDW